VRTRKKKWAAGELENNPRIRDANGVCGVREFFNDLKPIHLEIGCGKGRFIIETSRRNPDINYVAVERDETILATAARRAAAQGAHPTPTSTWWECRPEPVQFPTQQESAAQGVPPTPTSTWWECRPEPVQFPTQQESAAQGAPPTPTSIWWESRPEPVQFPTQQESAAQGAPPMSKDCLGGQADVATPFSTQQKNSVGSIVFVGADVNDGLKFIRAGEISRLYINFCDPWSRKKKWAKRRLTHDTFLEIYEKLQIPEIFFKTDNRILFESSLESFSRRGWLLENISLDLHASDMPDNIMTEYEEKFSAHGPIYRLEARRRAGRAPDAD
jgi:tRNA G46 methylase TrmB